jgi:hypothetical protein
MKLLLSFIVVQFLMQFFWFMIHFASETKGLEKASFFIYFDVFNIVAHLLTFGVSLFIFHSLSLINSLFICAFHYSFKFLQADVK